MANQQLQCLSAAAIVTAVMVERSFDMMHMADSSKCLDLEKYEGLLNSPLIRAPSRRKETTKWSDLRQQHRSGSLAEVLKRTEEGLTRSRSANIFRKTELVQTLSGMVKSYSELAKHSAVVFDCHQATSVVYRLKFDPTNHVVQIREVARAAGVAELLVRHAIPQPTSQYLMVVLSMLSAQSHSAPRRRADWSLAGPASGELVREIRPPPLPFPRRLRSLRHRNGRHPSMARRPW